MDAAGYYAESLVRVEVANTHCLATHFIIENSWYQAKPLGPVGQVIFLSCQCPKLAFIIFQGTKLTLSSQWFSGVLALPEYEHYIFCDLWNQVICIVYLWAHMVFSLQLIISYFLPLRSLLVPNQVKSRFSLLNSILVCQCVFYVPSGQTLPASALSAFSFCISSGITHSVILHREFFISNSFILQKAVFHSFQSQGQTLPSVNLLNSTEFRKGPTVCASSESGSFTEF